MDRFDTSKDPRFKRAPRHVRRVQVDGRFARMFKDQQFVETPRVDARGERLRRNAGKQKLREFYELAGVEGAEKIEDEAEEVDEAEHEDADQMEDLEESEEEDEEEAQQFFLQRLLYYINTTCTTQTNCPLRPLSLIQDEVHDEAVPEEIPQGDATSRLAVMGCDWDHVSAGDLMVRPTRHGRRRARDETARSRRLCRTVDEASERHHTEMAVSENRPNPWEVDIPYKGISSFDPGSTALGGNVTHTE